MTTHGVAELPQGMPRKPVLVVGAYGYRNVGDEAILAGLLRLLGRDGVTVVSRAPAETAARYGVAAVGIAGALPALRRHHGLVIGGGGLFGRDLGLVGRLLPVFGLLASAMGRDVAVVGVGIDRAMPRLGAWLLSRLARRARLVTVRDLESANQLAILGIAAELRPDLSILAPSAGRATGLAALRSLGFEPRRRPVIGLALTAVNAGLVEPMTEAVIAAVDALPDVDFCLIPMSRHPFVAAHNDELLARRLVERRPRLRILGSDDPAVVLGVFEALSAAVCMRYHSLLFAERCGVPTIPIAYAEKCIHWLSERGRRPLQLTGPILTGELRAALGGRRLQVAGADERERSA
jgi:polysaccharide pyruvyl transferase WcaK-like protein